MRHRAATGAEQGLVLSSSGGSNLHSPNTAACCGLHALAEQEDAGTDPYRSKLACCCAGTEPEVLSCHQTHTIPLPAAALCEVSWERQVFILYLTDFSQHAAGLKSSALPAAQTPCWEINGHLVMCRHVGSLHCNALRGAG